MLACQRRIRPGSSPTLTKEVHFPALLTQVLWEKIETVGPAFCQVKAKRLRPISFMGNELKHVAPRIEDLDLSQAKVLFSAIKDAIALGDLQRLERLVSVSPPPHETIFRLAAGYRKFVIGDCDLPSDCMTDLRTCAARYGQLDIIKFFVGLGLKLDDQYRYGLTPLHCAASHGHDTMVKYLLEQGMDIDFRNSSNETALDIAMACGLESTVKLLFQGRLKNFAWSETHPLYESIISGRLEMVRLFFELGMRVQHSYEETESPLHVAARLGHTEIVRFLLDARANVDESFGPTHKTPLCSALAESQRSVARVLIERGASLDGIEGKFGTTPLLSASAPSADDRNNHDDMIYLLISNGANVNLCRPRYRPDEETRTALTEVCSRSYASTQVIGRLLQHGADINLGCPTPLEQALQGEQGVETARLLLRAGANVDLLSRDCTEMLRGLADGVFDKKYLGWPWKFCREASEKVQLLGDFTAVDSIEVIEISSGEESPSDALSSDEEA